MQLSSSVSGYFRLFIGFAYIIPMFFYTITGFALAQGTMSEILVDVQNCRIEAVERAMVVARREGYILEMPLQPGDAIEAQGKLAGLAKDRLELEVARTASELESLVINSENLWRCEMVRVRLDAAKEYKELLDDSDRKGARVTTAEFLEQDRKIEEAAAELAEAVANNASIVSTAAAKRAELALKQLDFKHSDVTSPFSGIIAKIFHRRGEFVRFGDPIAEVVRMDKLVITLPLSERTCPPHVLRGSAVEFAIEITTNIGEPSALRKFTGAVSGVLPEVDRDGRYFAISTIENIQAEDTSGASSWVLRPGMVGTARIAVGRRHEGLR